MFVHPPSSRLLRMFPVPAFLRMPAVGFDISDHAIRLVESLPTPTGLAIGRFGSYPLPEGTIVGGAIQNAEVLIHVMEQARDDYGLNLVRASLPAEQAYLFTLALANPLSPPEVRTTIEFKLEENIPIAPHDAVFDYMPLAAEEHGPLEVSVVAVPLAIVRTYREAFDAAGLTPVSFEIEPEALARAVVSLEAGATMVVDFGAQKTGISIESRGAVQFTTMLDIGSTNLTAVIEKALRVSTEEAERMKREHGFTQSESNAAVVDALMNPLSALKDEIGRHREYWETYGVKKAAHPPIEQVILCGGGANLRGLTEYLGAALGCRVALANVWNHWFSFDTTIPSIPFDESLSYATAVGLAMRG